jgi:2-polyprenyl-3-methyl-5-hydroxy-6-metoxy-1,4-benzoquinol methylase
LNPPSDHASHLPPPLRDSFACDRCQGALVWTEQGAQCACGRLVPVIDQIPRFIDLPTHEAFGLQWKLFNEVQIDSKNGTTESRDRLLLQSQLNPQDFRGRLVLEVGCGAGRFTEVMLAFGARVIAVDYSAAVEACAELNARYLAQGQLAAARTDVFQLPFREQAFDMVVGYGMLQHTGDAARALLCLWRHVRPGGLLLVDRYQLSLRHFLPFKYALRPLTRRLPPQRTLSYVERLCHVMVPIQRAVLRRAPHRGAGRWVRYAVNRSPNAVYPLNLELAGKLGKEVAERWSVLETFDQYAPRFDSPCTAGRWRTDLEALEGGEVLSSGSAGQGNVGVVRRRSEPDQAPAFLTTAPTPELGNSLQSP